MLLYRRHLSFGTLGTHLGLEHMAIYIDILMVYIQEFVSKHQVSTFFLGAWEPNELQ